MGAQYSNNLDVIKVITYLTSTRACNKAHWIVKIWGNTFVTTSQQCGFCVVRIAVKRQSVTLTLAATLTRNICDKHSKPKHTINSVKWLTLTLKKKKVVRTYLHFLQPTRLFVVRASRRLKLLLMRLLGNELSRETMDPQVPELNRRAQKQSVIVEFITNH